MPQCWLLRNLHFFLNFSKNAFAFFYLRCNLWISIDYSENFKSKGVYVMGYPTKIQLISRKDKNSNQWYVNFPNALAQAMNFEKGEIVEWTVENINVLKMERKRKELNE